MYSPTLSFTSAVDGEGDQRHAPAALPPGKRPGTGWAAGPNWTGQVQKISPPTGIRSLDRSARSESICRLCYPGSNKNIHP